MKCNASEITKQKDVYSTIHKAMSYDDLLTNTIAIPEEQIPTFPVVTQLLMVKRKIDFIVEEIDMFCFLDVNSIHSFKKLSSEKHPLVPITLTLLDKYGVTKEQFIKDSECKGFVAIPNQLQA